MKKVGNYKFRQQPIGKGSYSKVYMGENITTQEPVAVKVIQISQSQAKLVASVETELQILGRLRHPNIIHVLDALRTSSNLYMIMEYCSGGDLQNFIYTQGSVPQSTGKKWIFSLLKALQFLRNNKILHRDLKLANIFMTEKTVLSDIKLGDFGFAKVLEEDNMASTELGTPLYMAPEIFKGEKYSHKADIWSLGVISYEMLVGNTPFVCSNINELLREQMAPIFFPADPVIEEEAKDLISKMLTYKAEERPDFEELLSHPFLQDYIEDFQDLEEENIQSEEERKDLPEAEQEEEKEEEEKQEEEKDSFDTESFYSFGKSPEEEDFPSQELSELEEPSAILIDLPEEKPKPNRASIMNLSNFLVNIDFQLEELKNLYEMRRRYNEGDQNYIKLALTYYAKYMSSKFLERLDESLSGNSLLDTEKIQEYYCALLDFNDKISEKYSKIISGLGINISPELDEDMKMILSSLICEECEALINEREKPQESYNLARVGLSLSPESEDLREVQDLLLDMSRSPPYVPGPGPTVFVFLNLSSLPILVP